MWVKSAKWKTVTRKTVTLSEKFDKLVNKQSDKDKQLKLVRIELRAARNIRDFKKPRWINGEREK